MDFTNNVTDLGDILVVDDELKLRDMLFVYSYQEGYRAVEAGNGR